VIKGVYVLVAVRLKSSRLPRKALCDLSGAPVIARLMERMRLATTPEDIVVCTSTHPEDTPLADEAGRQGWSCHRGHELDVIGRFLDYVVPRNANTIVRVTGDNPLTDPKMLDHMVQVHRAKGMEYTYTEDLPRGTRCEVIDVAALQRCHQLAQNPDASEYMTLMIRRPDRFRVHPVETPWSATRRPELRLTLDTPEDYEVLSAIYKAYSGTPPDLEQVITWLDEHPAVRELNAHIAPYELDASINTRLQGD